MVWRVSTAEEVLLPATHRSQSPTDWLSPRSPEDERLLLRESSLVCFTRGQTIFSPTEKPRTVFGLERGLVRIYRLGEAGAEVTLGYAGKGEVFGELGAFGDHPRESFAVAALASTVRRFTRRGFDQLLSGSPDRVMRVTRQIARRLKRAESRVEHLVLDDARSRLIAMLLELADDFGEKAGERVRLEFCLSQSELASLIGATRQTVNAILTELRSAGLVSQEAGLLVLPSRAALRCSLGSPLEYGQTKHPPPPQGAPGLVHAGGGRERVGNG
jgi:CRP/FNR family cyclic AMP-dependent transcriptional regulator